MESEQRGMRLREVKAEEGYSYTVSFSEDDYRQLSAQQIEAELSHLTASIKAAIYRDWGEAHGTEEPAWERRAPVPTERKWSWEGDGEAEMEQAW